MHTLGRLILTPAAETTLLRASCSLLFNKCASLGLPSLESTASSSAASSFCSSQLAANNSCLRHQSSLHSPTPKPQDVSTLIPDHEIETGLPKLQARIRQKVGSNYCYRLRKGQKISGQLSSLPGNASIPLELDLKEAAKLVRTYGRNGLQCHIVQLDIVDAAGQAVTSCRVLPKAVHISSTKQELENLVLMYCPQQRAVDVHVPIQMWNSEICPGVKKGGWLHVVNRTVALKCPGTHIPSRIELDMRNIDVHNLIRFSDLQLPTGCYLRVKDPTQPVVRCTARGGAGGD